MNLFLLRELVVVLILAIAVIYIFEKAKLPPVVGFLLTGILIGPGGLSIVKDTHNIDILAEIGVVMLLFTLGIEFSIERLKKIRKSFWLGGGLQVSLTIMIVGLCLNLFKIPLNQAVFYGFLVSLSSTAVVLRILSDRKEINSVQGRVSLGVLLFQDVALVPMIALVPVLANLGSVSFLTISTRFILSALAIMTVFFMARKVMPSILHLVVKTKIREIFLLAALVCCLGLAVLTSMLGLSLALGAFLAGIIISESEYSHQVVSDIVPFKDVFNSLFFISIGMMLNTRLTWDKKWIILAAVVFIIFIKTIITGSIIKLIGHSTNIAAMTGVNLAQVGEFSFVLAGVGMANALITSDIFQVFIASSILTILATPFLIQSGPAFINRLFSKTGPHLSDKEKALTQLKGHVVIAGFGLNGQNLSRVLKQTGIPYLIIELNPETIVTARKEGEPIIFGDVASSSILRECGLERAKGIVFAISDPVATRRGVKAARLLNPEAFIIVRTRFASEIEELFSLGASEVIPEEFETSIEIFVRVLEKFHLPPNIIKAQVQVIRGECYGMLRGTCTAARPMSDRVADLLSAGTVESFLVPIGSWLAGKTLGELDLREKTGATIINIVRRDKSFASPGASMKLEEHDVLVLVADHTSMDKAFRYLTEGRSE